MQAPAAISWVSEMAKDVKARTVATMNAATAKESCMGFDLNTTTPQSAIRKRSSMSQLNGHNHKDETVSECPTT